MKRVVLSNGVRLIVRQMRAAPVVALNLWVGSGSSDEPEELSGISHFMEHLLFKGSSGKTGRRVELATEVHAAGGYLNAETGCDHTMYYQVVPSEGWRGILRSSALALSSPAFRDDEVETERAVVIEEARSGENDPSIFVWRRLLKTAFEGLPCGRPIVGTPESVSRITKGDLRRHHETYHRAGNLVQLVVGDVDEDEAVEAATDVLAVLPSGTPAAVRPTVRPREGGLRALTYGGRVEQPYVAIAFDGPHALHDDVPALDALCGLLGAGHSSRLWRSLRSGDGSVSDIAAGLVAYRDSGLILVRAVATGTDTEGVVEGVFRETERLRIDPPGAAEMEKNLRRLESAYALEHETADSIARTLGYFETLGDSAWAEEYVDRLAGVSSDDIARAARRYLNPDAATVVCCVPGRAGGAGMDRSSAMRAAAARAAGATRSAAGAVSTPAWSPPASFSRPDVLREGGRVECSRLPMPGGGTMVARRSGALPLVSLTLGFRGGFLEEPDEKTGLTYLTQRMCREGTRSRSADGISEAIEGLGTGLAFAVERDGLGAGLTVMSKHLGAAMEILGDVLVGPTFPEERLDQAKLQVTSEIREIDDHPIRRALKLLLPLAFPGLPHGRPIRGTCDTISAMSAQELRNWHELVCSADRLFACVVGDVSPERAVDVVSGALEGMSSSHGVPNGSGHTASDAADANAAKPRPVGEERSELPGSNQSVVAIALPGPRGGTREAIIGRLIIRALSTIGGRLWRSLRDRPPHAYHVAGTLLSYRDAGATVAYATAAPGTEAEVIEGLAAEFSVLASSGLEPEELERTKRQLAGTLEISLMRGAARSATYAMAEVMGAGYEYVERMSSEVATITNDDVVAVATSLLDPSNGFARVVLRGVPT